MSKRFGKKRVPDCECTERYTCGPCLRAAGATGSEFFQTPVRGTNESEYEIYVTNAEALGWSIKTSDEWMAS